MSPVAAAVSDTLNISKTSKLDGVRSWSLEALATCPGSRDLETGLLVPACAGCYATTNFYLMPDSKRVRAENKEDWQRDEWESDMVAELRKDRWFRWFDSGDMYTVTLAWKIYRVMRDTPHVKHWLPTRCHKFAKYAEVLAAMQALPNVMVRFSSDHVDGTYTEGLHGSCIIPTADKLPNGVQLCHAANNDGKCGPCRACYDRDVPVIGYVAHGAKMNKVLRGIGIVVEKHARPATTAARVPGRARAKKAA